MDYDLVTNLVLAVDQATTTVRSLQVPMHGVADYCFYTLPLPLAGPSTRSSRPPLLWSLFVLDEAHHFSAGGETRARCLLRQGDLAETRSGSPLPSQQPYWQRSAVS